MKQNIVFKKKKSVVNTQQDHKLQEQVYQDPKIGEYKLKCGPGDVITDDLCNHHVKKREFSSSK